MKLLFPLELPYAIQTVDAYYEQLTNRDAIVTIPLLYAVRTTPVFKPPEVVGSIPCNIEVVNQFYKITPDASSGVISPAYVDAEPFGYVQSLSGSLLGYEALSTVSRALLTPSMYYASSNRVLNHYKVSSARFTKVECRQIALGLVDGVFTSTFTITSEYGQAWCQSTLADGDYKIFKESTSGNTTTFKVPTAPNDSQILFNILIGYIS